MKLYVLKFNFFEGFVEYDMGELLEPEYVDYDIANKLSEDELEEFEDTDWIWHDDEEMEYSYILSTLPIKEKTHLMRLDTPKTYSRVIKKVEELDIKIKKEKINNYVTKLI